MTHIIILNGPPRSGKDTAAQMLAEIIPNSTRCSFKKKLLDFWQLSSGAKITNYEKAKDTTNLRSELIHLSENIIKPALGKDFFAKVAAAEVLAQSTRFATEKTFIFDDGGFPEELEVMKKCFPRVSVVQIVRKKHTFHNDSRKFFNEGDTIFNNTTTEDLADNLKRWVVRRNKELQRELKQCEH